MGRLQGLSNNPRGNRRAVSPEYQHSLVRPLPGTEAKDDGPVSGGAGGSAGDGPTEPGLQGHQIGRGWKTESRPSRCKCQKMSNALGTPTAAVESLPTWANSG